MLNDRHVEYLEDHRSFIKRQEKWLVVDSCRMDNQKIIPLISSGLTISKPIWGFVPAAGVASRYGKNLSEPKALLPCVSEGMTYLEMKIAEHEKLGCLKGQIFVAPLGKGPDFEAHIKTSLPTFCIEQDRSCSTVRFLENGQEYRDPEGRLSFVPGGHGALTKLFPYIRKQISPLDEPSPVSLFIRNVDNVGGIGLDFLQETRAFLAMYSEILSGFEALRQTHVTEGLSILKELIPSQPLTLEQNMFLEREPDQKRRSLWRVLFECFHLPLFLAKEKSLEEVLSRPLNMLGMVPRVSQDVGGCPIVTNTSKGPISLCVEGPHMKQPISPQISITHFNPVFVCSELISQAQAYFDPQGQFAMTAEKIWNEQKVFYHESLLYELLGNSLMSNLVFVQVSRQVFHPHKTMEEAQGKSRSDWGF